MNTLKQDRDRDNVFHERADLLRTKSYRGYRVLNTRKRWDGVRITVRNARGLNLSASGDTPEEAYVKVIDKIDFTLDEPRT